MTGARPEPAEPDEVDDLEEPTRLDAAPPASDQEAAFERLLTFLKESRAFDFTGYKRPSLVRRIRYRMKEVGQDSVEDYQDFLQLHPDEFTALFNTIMINVTSFFRDADSWQHLASDILPELLRSTEGGPVRVWSAGCAAGQEAYSIAMLLHRTMGDSFRDRVKIYATDIDDEALDHARQASYTDRELQGLPEEYRARYFEESGGRWLFTPELRRNVIFGRNDLTQDAPISRLDLLLCRNTLMYLNAETQSRVVSRLGFALRPGGVLFLGKAEMLLNHTASFDPVDLKRRFFRRISSGPADSGLVPPWRLYGRADVAASHGDELRSELIATNPVAQIAVGVDGRLLMVNQRAAALFGLSQRDIGRSFSDLEISYRPLELRSQLASAVEGRNVVSLQSVEWRQPGRERVFLDVQLIPLVDVAGRVLGTSITMTDVTRYRELQAEVETANRQLENAYEELQSTNEELETTNEELQSTVEELETTNEELQSTNEELETMNEELQSANDELQIVNEQLRDRSIAVTELNEFTQRILDGLDAAVVVVTHEHVVRLWSRQAEELWGLLERETVGQHLMNLDSGLPGAELQPWLRAVTSRQEQVIRGQHLRAINRRGRPVDLRVKITAMTLDVPDAAGALIMFEQLGDDQPAS